MFKTSTAPQMNIISAQIVPYTHKKSNSGLSSSIESRFYLQYFVIFILQNGKTKKKDLLNLNTRVQVNKVEWMA